MWAKRLFQPPLCHAVLMHLIGLPADPQQQQAVTILHQMLKQQ